MSKMIDLNLSALAAGGVQENFDMEIHKVFENIQDLNTEAKTARKLTLSLTLSPDENREIVAVDSQIRLNLAPTKSITTNIITGVDLNGSIEAKELKSGVKGQMYFDEDAQLRTDTGQPVEEIEKPKKVIDLRNLQKKEG